MARWVTEYATTPQRNSHAGAPHQRRLRMRPSETDFMDCGEILTIHLDTLDGWRPPQVIHSLVNQQSTPPVDNPVSPAATLAAD
jgi:hypothetical protein